MTKRYETTTITETMTYKVFPLDFSFTKEYLIGLQNFCLDNRLELQLLYGGANDLRVYIAGKDINDFKGFLYIDNLGNARGFNLGGGND